MKELKLGVIGLSPGNGHPFSWSAIFNGFDSEKMKANPYPVIFSYLNKQKFPEDAIPGAAVTHIWTQNQKTSEQIALASKIPNIVTDLTDMIGKVDAILLARDDAEFHFEMAEPFVRSGLPIFIDKPLAYTLSEAKKIMSLESYAGQIFTCSSLRYSNDLLLTSQQRAKIGIIKSVTAVTPKDWKKYSIHIIEPSLVNLGLTAGPLEKFEVKHQEDKTKLTVQWRSGVTGSFSSVGSEASPIQIQFSGELGTETLIFKDTFQAFKASLLHFVGSIREKKRIIPTEETYACIDIVEKGLKKI
jgi:hypothetical protein